MGWETTNGVRAGPLDTQAVAQGCQKDVFPLLQLPQEIRDQVSVWLYAHTNFIRAILLSPSLSTLQRKARLADTKQISTRHFRFYHVRSLNTSLAHYTPSRFNRDCLTIVDLQLCPPHS